MLRRCGLRGSFLIRDLNSGEELGLEPDLEFPAASLVNIPLAIATQDRIHRGEIDGAQTITVHPQSGLSTPPGISSFRHPAEVSADDLVYLSVALSDSAAADALFKLTPPTVVMEYVRRIGLRGLTVRHPIQDLVDVPTRPLEPKSAHLAHQLAIQAGTAGRGHRIPQLDTSRSSSGSARVFADLLQALWRPSAIATAVAGRIRLVMAQNVHRQRLSVDFQSDSARWSSKTATLLNLRHEIGVVEHDDGDIFAVVALTESSVAAVHQPMAEAAMGQIARSMRDRLRQH